MLELQLSEVEMLQSMFPSPGEFKMDNGPEALEEIQAFIDGKIKAEYLESRLGFIVNIITTKVSLGPITLQYSKSHYSTQSLKS